MDCPTCEKSLRTERGVRQHHTNVNGDPLPNRTCTGCDAEFYDPKARREFCDDCNPNAGEHNGNYRDATETAECRQCGDAFDYYPSDKDGVYCPSCVAAADGLLPENPAKRDRVDAECQWCGEVLSLVPSRLDGLSRGPFCDVECYGEWLSANVVGDSHHQWEGGVLAYGDGWWAVRRDTRERDGHSCQICGADADELGREPDVHHIVRVREFDDPGDAHRLDNVVTLCRSCHRRVEDGSLELT